MGWGRDSTAYQPKSGYFSPQEVNARKANKDKSNQEAAARRARETADKAARDAAAKRDKAAHPEDYTGYSGADKKKNRDTRTSGTSTKPNTGAKRMVKIPKKKTSSVGNADGGTTDPKTAGSNSRFRGKYAGPDRFKGDQEKVAKWYRERGGTNKRMVKIPKSKPSRPIGLADSSSGQTYTVRRGDTLTAIAGRQRTSVANILAKNPRLRKNPNLIYRGTKVKI